jgi:hypothetical protein
MAATMMRILVCGSRTWKDEGLVRGAVIGLGGDRTIITGGARGPDSMAAQVAQELGFDLETYYPDWKRWGRGAGPIRNQLMLEKGEPGVVYAFWDGRSTGTRDMIDRAVHAGVPVRIYYQDGRVEER